MKTQLTIWIWQLTGWVPPSWSRRDNDGRLRYWHALVLARYQLVQCRSSAAWETIDKALEWQ